MARFFPQDTFDYVTLVNSDDGIEVQNFSIDVDEEIADPFFSKNFERNKEKEQWLDVEDPRFINWMVG